MPTPVSLSAYELKVASEAGVYRHRVELASGKRNKINNRDFGWHTDIEAACSEAAVAKWLGVWWDDFGIRTSAFSAPDIRDIEVKHTQYPNGHLIIRETDLKHTATYLLVTGANGVYVIHGWIYGHEATEMPECWQPNENPPFWKIPQQRLHDENDILNRR